MVLGFYVSLLIMIALVMLIFADHIGAGLVYNGEFYPVEFKNGRVACKLFGAVERYEKENGLYNVFGYELSLEYGIKF